MHGLIDFQNVTVTGGAVEGFSQPWDQYSGWAKREGRLQKPEEAAYGNRALTLDALPPAQDVEVVALTQAYNLSRYARPVGANRGILVRAAGGAANPTGIVVDVFTDADRIHLRGRELVAGEMRLLFLQTYESWARIHGDHLFRIRVKTIGSTVRAKIWWDHKPEPEHWTVSATTTVTEPGRVGVFPQGTFVQEYVWFGYSDQPDTSAPMGGPGLTDKMGADYRGLIPLVEGMCYPIVADNPTGFPPESETNVKNDIEVARPAYRAARSRAIEIMTENRLPVPTPGDIPLGYSHCSRFSGTVILNLIDRTMAAEMTASQNAYFEDWRNGWVQVGSSEHYDPSWCRPGDVWVTREPGHVWVWIGDYGGYNDVIAEAQFNGLLTQQSRVGLLRRWNMPASGIAANGRSYSAWRFIGRQPKRAFLQTANGMVQVDTFLQTEDGVVEYQL